jgi:hypothetical protein
MSTTPEPTTVTHKDIAAKKARIATETTAAQKKKKLQDFVDEKKRSIAASTKRLKKYIKKEDSKDRTLAMKRARAKKAGSCG